MHILTVGKGGHGKSSVCNSLLMRREVFKTGTNGGMAMTRDVKMERTICDGETIYVIDTPGLCDTRNLTPAQAADAVVRNMKNSMARCPNGINAAVFVLNYCSPRFTEEEASVFRALKDVFSPLLFQQFTYVVFTHKDNFDRDQMRTNPQISFDDWCRSLQEPNLVELLRLCNYRCMAFDNYNPTEEQRTELVRKIRQMNPEGDRYTQTQTHTNT